MSSPGQPPGPSLAPAGRPLPAPWPAWLLYTSAACCSRSRSSGIRSAGDFRKSLCCFSALRKHCFLRRRCGGSFRRRVFLACCLLLCSDPAAGASRGRQITTRSSPGAGSPGAGQVSAEGLQLKQTRAPGRSQEALLEAASPLALSSWQESLLAGWAWALAREGGAGGRAHRVAGPCAEGRGPTPATSLRSFPALMPQPRGPRESSVTTASGLALYILCVVWSIRHPDPGNRS